MKLLTAIIPAHQHQRVVAALESAGLTVTTVATAEAPALKPSTGLWHRGTQYQDQRCLRLEVLVSDVDVEIVFGLLAPTGGPASDEVIVWATDVAVPSAPLLSGTTAMSAA